MYQKLIIVGNLGRDPELRYLADGTAVTSMSVATSTYAGADKPPVTSWFRVSVWGKRAETVNEYLKRGNRVMVEGTLQTDPETGGPRTYNKSDGTVGASYEVRADNVVFLTSRVEADAENRDAAPF